MKFRLPVLFQVMAFVAVYAAIPRMVAGDKQLRGVLFLVVSLVFLISFGPLQKKAVWFGAAAGGILGGIWHAISNYAEPFHPKDQLFYLALHFGLLAAVGALVGYSNKRDKSSKEPDA